MPVSIVSYVLGSQRPGHYSGHLVVSVPAAALAVRSDGTTPLNASAADGATHSFVHIIDLEAGESAEWTFEIDLPDSMTELTLEPSGRYPAIDWTVDGVSVPDQRRTITLADG